MTQTSPRHNGNGAANGSPKTPIQPEETELVLLSPDEETGTQLPSQKQVRAQAFDQPVILQQTSLWSKLVVGGIISVTSAVLLWAAVARIEEAVPATGKLEPGDRVQEIQAPVGGVVKEILVGEGERVQQGQVLIRFDPTAAAAQRRSLEQLRDSYLTENQFYRSALSGISLEPSNQSQSIPPEMRALLTNRAALASETALFRAQVYGGDGSFSDEERIRLSANQLEAQSRAAAAQLEVAQLQQQLIQTQEQLSTARQTLAIDEGILRDIEPLAEQGALSRIQMLRQRQQMMDRRAEVNRLTLEEQRLSLAVDQARQRLSNTVATTSTDLLARVADNEKRIADIDSQINRAIVDNERRIAEINSQLSQTELTLKYQELRAPIDGVVFDLKARGIGFVANTSEPILKVVPTDNLLAEVYITNKDIGFVSEGLPVDVRIDSFPFSEFGDIKGEVVNIGEDALPPDQIYPFYRFPAKIRLDSQTLKVNGREIPLQSGMAVTANIITRDRTVLSIFTDLFSRRIESIKTVR